MVGENQLPAAPEFFRAAEGYGQHARPLQVADKKPPHAPNHAAGGKLARHIAPGGFKRVGQEGDFKQHACHAEQDEAQHGGEKAAQSV